MDSKKLKTHIKTIGLATLAIGILSATASADSTTSSTASTGMSVQQQFDAGTAAMDSRDWRKAFDIYSKLEESFAAKGPSSKSLLIVRLRKARAMAALGQLEEAEPLLSNTLDSLPESPELLADRYSALEALAAIAEGRFDYPQAIARLHEAAAVAEMPVQKLSAFTRSIPIAIFVDPASALRDAEEAQRLLDSLQQPSPEWAGLIHNYRGRALMNMGQLEAARKELDEAIKLLGGLSRKIDLLDAAARSDAAIAAMLAKEPTRAVKLLSYAGASAAAAQGFIRGRDMNPPLCLPQGPKPDDVAVVEFAIGDDGSVTAARPIYFSGEPSMAVDFARAVSQWSWNPEDLKHLDLFFRVQSRVELRCTTVFNRPESSDLLFSAVDAWIRSKSLEPSNVAANQPEGTRLASLKVELQKREAESGGAALALLPTLIALSRNPVISQKESTVFAERAYETAKAAGAQGQVLAWFLLRSLQYSGDRWGGTPNGKYQRRLIQALADPALTADARADAAIRIALFDSLAPSARKKDGRAFIGPLAASAKLPPSDPFVVGAHIRLANLEHLSGHTEAAQLHFQQTGVSAQQCALLDTKPVLTRRSEFIWPTEAQSRKMGGWTKLEFDISSDGVPIGVRTIVAFPPFVYGPSAEKSMSGIRYQATYRPGSEKGCVGYQLATSYMFK